MKFRLEIDSSLEDLEVTVRAPRYDAHVAALEALAQKKPLPLVGYADERAHLLDPSRVIRLYIESKRLYAETKERRFELRWTLRDLLDRLGHEGFLATSQSEAVNLARVKRLDLSMRGTLAVRLENDVTVYVARRYVRSFKDALGL